MATPRRKATTRKTETPRREATSRKPPAPPREPTSRKPASAPVRSSKAARYALLVRGINVGTKNSLPMAELRAMLEELGCGRVATHIQSGNAVFDTRLDAAELRAAIEQRLEARMGRPIATSLRTGAELTAIVAANPFAGVATNPANLCVTFLSDVPTDAELAPLRDQDFAPDLLHVAGTEIYTWHPAGQGKSRLAAALAKLRVRGTLTTRNWNTVQTLVAMLDAR